MFNILDHLFLGFLALMSDEFLGIGLLILIFMSSSKKSKHIFLVIPFSIILWALYSIKFSDKICDNYFKLDKSQCFFLFTPPAEITEKSKETFGKKMFYFVIRRNLNSEQNGLTLGKDTSFFVKQESMYVQIPLSLQFKNNDSLFLLETDRDRIIEQVENFMNFKEDKGL